MPLVHDLPTTISATATAGQTIFTFPFKIYAVTDLEVYVNGTLMTYAAVPVGTSQYSVAPGVDEGGSIIFGAGRTLSDIVIINSVIPLERVTQFPNSGPVPMSDVNLEFNRHVRMLQDLASQIGRSPLFPLGTSAPAVPSPTGNGGKFLGLDLAGNFVWAAGGTGDSGLRVDLATNGAGKGGLLMALNDGASGALFTTAQGFVTKLLSTTGATLVGWLRSATGAVMKAVSTKLGFRLDAEDFFPDNWNPATTDVTTYLQAAINEAAASGKTLYLPPAFKCGALTVPANTHIYGQGKKSNITAIAGSYDMFTVTGSHVKIENLWIEDAAKTGGWDIVIACGTNTLKFLTFSNIVAQNSFGLVTDSGTGTNQAGSHIVVLFHDVLCGAHRGPGFQMTRGYAYQFFERCSVDYVGISASNFTAYAFNPTGMGGAAGGYTFVDCTVTGTCGTYNNAAQHGWSLQNAAAVWMERCSADTVAGTGMILNNINGIKSTDCWVSLCGGDGMTLTTVFNSNFTSFNAWGRNYLSPNGAGTDGIRFISGCFSVNFTGGTISSWGRHGANKSAVQAGGIRFTGTLFLSNGLAGVGYGVNDTGNSALHLIGCGFGSNQQGNGNLTGTFSYYSVCQLNSGVVQSGAGAAPGVF